MNTQIDISRRQNEYSLPSFVFGKSGIWVIEDDSGNIVKGAKYVKVQSFMADFITRKVFELTQEPIIAVHGSLLAGGRISMPFYFCYAMYLFGRDEVG